MNSAVTWNSTMPLKAPLDLKLHASQKPELKIRFGDDGDTDRWIRKFQSMQSGNTPRQDTSKGCTIR